MPDKSELLGLAHDAIRPRQRLNIWQWAEANRYLAKGASNASLRAAIKYSSNLAPHQRKPQESMTAAEVHTTVLVMASQVGGKTEMFNNIIGYFMDYAPRSTVIMYPNLDASEKYSKRKFTPMVEATPCLKQIVKPPRSRDSSNTIMSKDFLGGSVYFVSSNSPPSLRGTSGAVLLADEIDSYRPNSEGDPIELLWRRGESFPNAVRALSSTPTLAGSSLIWSWFEESDQQFWFVPCSHCHKTQVLKWSQVVWPKDRPQAAELQCVHCAKMLNDKQRLEMYFAGDWKATAEFKGIAGFHLSGIYAPWPASKGFRSRLHQMATEHIRATKKGESALQVWVNTFLCEPFEVETERIDALALTERCEDYSPNALPDDICMIISAVDVQRDRLECELIGLGVDDETWGIEYRRLFGDTEQAQVWDDLADQLSQKFKRRDGVELDVTATGIDIGHRPHRVREFLRRPGLKHVYQVYGTGDSRPELHKQHFNKQYRLWSYSVNTKRAKDTIFARLRAEHPRGAPPWPRWMHFPKGYGYDDEYFSQLTAEVVRRRKVKGVTIEAYEKVRERNEALDIRVYALAVVDILKPNLTHIANRLRPNKARIDAEITAPPVAAMPAPPQPRANSFRPGRRPGFVHSWR